MNSISKGWFACMSQKTLTLNFAECYVTTVSTLSTKLLEKVINLQDDKVLKKGCLAVQCRAQLRGKIMWNCHCIYMHTNDVFCNMCVHTHYIHKHVHICGYLSLF